MVNKVLGFSRCIQQSNRCTGGGQVWGCGERVRAVWGRGTCSVRGVLFYEICGLGNTRFLLAGREPFAFFFIFSAAPHMDCLNSRTDYLTINDSPAFGKPGKGMRCLASSGNVIYEQN